MPLISSANPLTTGFETLLRFNGETVTFRGKQVRALINRLGPKPVSNLPANVKLQTGTVIQFPGSLEKPKLGEPIIDTKEITHSIRDVKFLGHCWECVCDTIL